MRVGIVIKLLHDRRFGFIRADNLRSDVLFRYSVVEPASLPLTWYDGQEVEFDLDDLKRLEFGELEAAKVREATRPLSHRLIEAVKPGMAPAHHPKARRRKPIWRRADEEETKLSDENPENEPDGPKSSED